MMLSRAAGGTSVPLMLDCVMWLSIPNVYAECVKPANNMRDTKLSNSASGTVQSNLASSW